jgi:hypothetical protein
MIEYSLPMLMFLDGGTGTVNAGQSRPNERTARTHGTYVENRIIEHIDGPPAVEAHVHAMEAIKQLACAVIDRAVDDAQGIGWDAKANMAEARGFLLNRDGALAPWAMLAGLNVDAVCDYARKKGYDRVVILEGK